MEFKRNSHHYPLIPYLGEFDRLLRVICKDIPGFRPIPRFAQEKARHVLLSVLNRYTTQGRRFEAFVIASLGIARGDEDPDDLQDLVRRAEYLGMRVFSGQIKNTFNELKTFLKYHHLYERRNRKPKIVLTPEERRFLRRQRSRERLLAK